MLFRCKACGGVIGEVIAPGVVRLADSRRTTTIFGAGRIETTCPHHLHVTGRRCNRLNEIRIEMVTQVAV